MEGKVKFFDSKVGWGFLIDNEDDKEYFVHYSGTLDKIKQDDQVSFELETTDRGPRAINVKRIKL
jgi:cold shock protein